MRKRYYLKEKKRLKRLIAKDKKELKALRWWTSKRRTFISNLIMTKNEELLALHEMKWCMEIVIK